MRMHRRLQLRGKLKNSRPNNSNSTPSINNVNTFRSRGLDLNLFEGEVDKCFVCGICGGVLVQPEVSACRHVFCDACLRNNINHECSICRAPLNESGDQQAPMQLRLGLLELPIHCDHKCGQILPQGKLPYHVTNQCPNTPVTCPHANKGCRMMVKRCQINQHTGECDWRPVQCEACGNALLYKDMLKHQKKNRCVENRIRNQLVQAIKSTHKEAAKHRKSLEHQRVKMDKHQRRNEIDHVKNLQSIKSHRRPNTRGGNPTFHHREHSFSSTSSLDFRNNNNISNNTSNNNFSNYHNNHDTTRSIHSNNSNSRQFISLVHSSRLQPITSSVKVTNKQQLDNDDALTTDGTTAVANYFTQPASKQMVQENSTKVFPFAPQLHTSTTNPGLMTKHTTPCDFLTKAEASSDGEMLKGSIGPPSIPPSRETAGRQLHHFTCRRCQRRIRFGTGGTEGKGNTSCRWHAGPIIELFGGTCFACGRLDFQTGCMTGFHEI